MSSVFVQEILPLFDNARAEWLAVARESAYQLGQRGRVTIDDVRLVCPPPSDVDPRVMGAVFEHAKWEKTGYISSTRGHGRAVAIFSLR